MESPAAVSSRQQERDMFRGSLLRYVAFTSDLGESFKPFISRRLYLGSYAIVALYGLADTLDKGRRAHHRVAAARRPSTPLLSLPGAAPGNAALNTNPSCPPTPPSRPSGATLHQTAFAAASACTACLPPPAACHAGSAAEGRSTAVPVAAAVLDTALWHSAASLAIPAVAINRTVWATGELLARSGAAARLPARVAALAPSAAGLALIPLLVPRIDEAVTNWMDARLRPHLPPEALTPSTHHKAT